MISLASSTLMQQISLRIVRLWSGGANHSRESSIRNLAAWLFAFFLSQQSHRSRRGRFLGQEEHVHGIDYESHAKLSR
ncbi:hypothetical protein FOFC_13921 [Fusarium oxysporum]|nr:hypothetical protein FOFC_13921 [Fusarium oxysporum]